MSDVYTAARLVAQRLLESFFVRASTPLVECVNQWPTINHFSTSTSEHPPALHLLARSLVIVARSAINASLVVRVKRGASTAAFAVIMDEHGGVVVDARLVRRLLDVAHGHAADTLAHILFVMASEFGHGDDDKSSVLEALLDAGVGKWYGRLRVTVARL